MGKNVYKRSPLRGESFSKLLKFEMTLVNQFRNKFSIFKFIRIPEKRFEGR